MNFTLIIAVVALLAAMLLPWLAGAHDRARRIQCVNNLKQSGLAFRIWEGDNGDKYPMDVPTNKGGTMEFTDGANTFRHFQVMSNELSTTRILFCPADAERESNFNEQFNLPDYEKFSRLKNRNVSYFVGLDARDDFPQRFLDGDRNLTADNAPENGILKLVPGQRVSWTETIHVNQGDVGLSDGSVQQYSNAGLQNALQNSGKATNTWRIAMPE
jgi:hypothetical protein